MSGSQQARLPVGDAMSWLCMQSGVSLLQIVQAPDNSSAVLTFVVVSTQLRGTYTVEVRRHTCSRYFHARARGGELLLLVCSALSRLCIDAPMQTGSVSFAPANQLLDDATHIKPRQHARNGKVHIPMQPVTCSPAFPLPLLTSACPGIHTAGTFTASLISIYPGALDANLRPAWFLCCVDSWVH